jgi:hypothetical protein
MLRSLLSLGLAVGCVASVGGSAGTGWAQGALPFKQTAPEANRQKFEAALRQQTVSEQEIEAAQSRLQDSLVQLQQLQARYPKSDAIGASIARVQELLKQVQQARDQALAQLREAQKTSQVVGHEVLSEATVAATLNGATQMSNLSAMTQARAAQGAEIADQTTAANGSHGQAHPPPHHHAARPPVSTAETTSLPHTTVQTPPPDPGHPPVAANPDDETEWFNKLKKGLLQYTVPDTMLWKVPSTVTVQINGEKNAAITPLDKQSGQASIKVARRMRVMVSAPANPDEFTIVPESDTQFEEYVPEDGLTTWHFSVTPRYTASSQQLVVRAWVIYDADTQRELPVYAQTVNVHVPGLLECLKRMIQGDPDYWVKYGLPGGAGFVFFSGLVTGLWKWLRRKKGQPSNPAGGS